MIRSFELIDRYGEELEYDLHSFLSLDLCDWFIGRDSHPWGKLSRLCKQLPGHGRFKAAVLDDDEYAEIMGLPEDWEDEDDDKGPKKKPNFLDYDPTLARLTDIADLLISVRHTLVQVNSEKGKAPPAKYLPRPESAFDRLKRRHAREKRDLLKDILLPGD